MHEYMTSHRPRYLSRDVAAVVTHRQLGEGGFRVINDELPIHRMRKHSLSDECATKWFVITLRSEITLTVRKGNLHVILTDGFA